MDRAELCRAFLKLKTPLRAITTHLARSPLGFVRLPALWCRVHTAAGDLKGVTVDDSSEEAAQSWLQRAFPG